MLHSEQQCVQVWGSDNKGSLFFILFKASIDNWSCQAYEEELHTRICPMASENHLLLLLTLHFTSDYVNHL